MAKKILIKANSSSTIGFGHFLRSKSLAEIYAEKGAEILYQTNESNQLLKSLPELQKHKVFTIPDNIIGTESDLKELLKVCEQEHIHWVVLDGYSYNQDFERSIVEKKIKLLRIDDFPDRPYFCDALINQNYGAERFSIQALPHTKLALGLNYLILDANYRNLPVTPKTHKTDDFNLVVSLGGALHLTKHLYLTLAQCLAKVPKKLNITFIIPGGAETLAPEIQKTLAHQHVKILDFTNDMATIFHQADMAIVAAGKVMWELIYTHTPFMALALNEEQDQYLRRMGADGICFNLGKLGVVTETELESKMIHFFEDQITRKNLAKKYEELIDRQNLMLKILSLMD